MTLDTNKPQDHLDALLKAAVDGIMVIDHRGTIQRANDAALRLFDYQDAGLVGKNISRLMPEPEASAHDGYIEKYLKTGEAGIIGIGRQVTGRRRDGQRIPIYLSVGQIDTTEQPQFIGVVRDLSTEERIRTEMRELEKQLTHAGRLVTLGEMSAGIAHEINQPLTAIAAFANAAQRMLGRNADPVELKDICQQISDQAHRAGEVVNKLRLLSRRGQSKREPTDINEIIRNILLLIEYNRNRSDIRLELSLDNTLPAAFADPVQIQQVVLNLVNNAIEALNTSNTRQRVVAIETRRVGDRLHISVTDTGPGVPDELVPRLFEPFFTTKETGFGLGLSICQSIAQAHGGHLYYQPADGGGSQFVLDLPQTAVG